VKGLEKRRLDLSRRAKNAETTARQEAKAKAIGASNGQEKNLSRLLQNNFVPRALSMAWEE